MGVKRVVRHVLPFPSRISLRTEAGDPARLAIDAKTSTKIRLAAKNALTIGAQLLGLIVINIGGHKAAEVLDLPIPGNVLGMLFLLALLALGVIRLEAIQAGATILIRHLAFFLSPLPLVSLHLASYSSTTAWQSSPR